MSIYTDRAELVLSAIEEKLTVAHQSSDFKRREQLIASAAVSASLVQAYGMFEIALSIRELDMDFDPDDGEQAPVLGVADVLNFKSKRQTS